ncbi:MAG: cation diffusion facilitator family transporter [Candidatus Deferrimicrobiaceae bacterium]
MHQHQGTNGNDPVDRRLWASAALNVAITLAEFVGGLLSGSLALLSDAAHNASDVVSLALAIWARKMGRKAATYRHTYGFRRVEVIAALANAVVLLAVTVLIAREAFHRFLHPEPVVQGLMLGVGIVALLANAGSVLLLHRHEKNDVNVRSAFLHLAQDALASLAVVIAALMANTRLGPYVDPATALVVGVVVLRSAYSLVRETVSTLLEGSPGGVDLTELVARVGIRFAPVSLHHVHLWEIGPGQRIITAHVALGRDMDGRTIESLFDRMKSYLREEWGVTHSTLEPEVRGCGEYGVLGQWETQVKQ